MRAIAARGKRPAPRAPRPRRIRSGRSSPRRSRRSCGPPSRTAARLSSHGSQSGKSAIEGLRSATTTILTASSAKWSRTTNSSVPRAVDSRADAAQSTSRIASPRRYGRELAISVPEPRRRLGLPATSSAPPSARRDEREDEVAAPGHVPRVGSAATAPGRGARSRQRSSRPTGSSDASPPSAYACERRRRCESTGSTSRSTSAGST